MSNDELRTFVEKNQGKEIEGELSQWLPAFYCSLSAQACICVYGESMSVSPCTTCVCTHLISLSLSLSLSLSAAVIEHVRDGATLRVILLPSYTYLTLAMSGVKVTD